MLMRGQSGVMDALIFMIIVTGASAMLVYVSGTYAGTTNQQVLASYSYEYAGNALVALRYAKDSDGNLFWDRVGSKFDTTKPDDLDGYMTGPGKTVLVKVRESSPAPETFFCVYPSSDGLRDFNSMCYNVSTGGRIAFDSSKPVWPCPLGSQSYSYDTIMGISGSGQLDSALVLCY